MTKKLLRSILLGALLLLFLVSCNSNNITVFSSAVSQINLEANGHNQKLSEYDSPYTICYENKDGTYSMYIFASPIQYKIANGYEVIDNTIIKSAKDRYAFENKANEIKTYFPKSLHEYFRVEKGSTFIEFKFNGNLDVFSEAKQKLYKNMYGDTISAVIYKRKDMDVIFYSTNAGIKSEIVLKDKPNSNAFSFTVKSSAGIYENTQNRYIYIYKMSFRRLSRWHKWVL